MKCGIITYTSAQNWGGQLQSYSLNEYIKSLGVDCELINYRSLDSRWFKPKKEIKDILYTLVKYKEDKLRVRRFEDFRCKELELSGRVYKTIDDLRELNPKYDCFITGSDQLWNCETEINYPFYLGFVDDNKKKISYAPSFGSDFIPEKFEQEVTRLLNRYQNMSVRERSGSDIVFHLTGKQIPVVVDPVFLHSENEWIQKLNIHKKKLEKRYVFVYTTERSESINRIVRKFHKEYPNCRIFSPFAIPGVKANVLKNIGPKEFLDVLYNSDFVIANSFHAIAFSLIFRIPFCAVKHSTRFARVRDLLFELEMKNRICEDIKGYQFNTIMNTKYIEHLEELICQSKDYLNNAIWI